MSGSATNSYLKQNLIDEDEEQPQRPGYPKLQSRWATTKVPGNHHSSGSDEGNISHPAPTPSGLFSHSQRGGSGYGRTTGAPQGGKTNRRMVLALDFGTTFTGVAFASVNTEADFQRPTIEVLRNWGSRMDNMDKVPSVISYTSSAQGQLQWGADIRDDALTLINQKLELELQDSTLDELDLTMYVLNGTRQLSFDYIRNVGPNPDFPCAAPDQIVTEYLRRVFECTREAIRVERLEQTKTPVDLVITMPVDWSYQARNSVFRAVRAAGFNDNAIPTLHETMLVSEPEAAAFYTARESGRRSLQVNKCFVLCDAGGGTVDAVSYQVKQLDPFLKLERVTSPTGRRCGSALIDVEFKRWLRKIIRNKHYAELDPTGAQQRTISPHTPESGPMRKLIKEFFAVKSKFTYQNRTTIKIELPAPLDRLSIPDRVDQTQLRVDQGQLIMTWDEMKMLMDKCVNPTVKLIMDQMGSVSATRGTEVKNILLVGGFGASPYLQEELRKNFKFVNAKLSYPEKDSLTAVVQGAVIRGIQRPHGEETTTMNHMTTTYGYVDNRSFRWFVERGDLVLGDRATVWESDSFWIVPRSGVFRTVTFRLFRFDSDGNSDDEEQELPMDWENGWSDVKVAGILRVPKGELQYGSDLSTLRLGLTGPLRWRITYDRVRAFAELLLKKRLMGRCDNISMGEESNLRPSAGPYDD